ncbi:MAG: phosphoadenylyl-sulfate reductase [Armatimonadota bacterium]|nr:phosphoadenylyl-sulfate reductase [Armatimonadota bacterium]
MTDIFRINEELSNATAQEVVVWAVKEFGSKIALASSFGAEDVALIDMLCEATDSPRVFFLDTGRLHQETYDVVERIRDRYGLSFEVYFPQTNAVENLMQEKGPNSFYNSIENRRECCHIRKVEPLDRALSGLDAWITGLRREQSTTRGELAKVELDESHGGILKINPLMDWTEEDVWAYIRSRRIPYNKLHDQGFPSIGCAPCTRAVKPGEDLRAGRWWWESPEHKECGLHIKVDSEKNADKR